MNRPETLWQALNCNTLFMGVGAVLAGNASAQIHGNGEFLPMTVCLLFIIFAQLTGNSVYRYHEQVCKWGGINNTDHPNRNATVQGYNKALFYKVSSFVCGMLALMMGLTVISMGGWWFAVVGVFIVIAGWLMTGTSTPMVLSPWSPVFTFILFGPVAVISTSLLESAHEAQDLFSRFDIGPALYISVIIGLMAANVNLVYNYATYFLFKESQHDTFSGSFGRRTTRIIFLANSVISLILGLVGCFDVSLTMPWLATSPGIICFCVNIYIWYAMKTFPRHELMKVAKWACLNVLLMGITTCIVAWIVGVPDDSHLKLF